MAAARLVALLVVALFLGTSADAGAQVWKPKMQPGARAKAKQATPKKSRKAKPARVRRARADKAPIKPKKKKARHARRKKFRDDDDFTIVEEDYPDED